MIFILQIIFADFRLFFATFRMPYHALKHPNIEFPEFFTEFFHFSVEFCRFSVEFYQFSTEFRHFSTEVCTLMYCCVRHHHSKLNLLLPRPSSRKYLFSTYMCRISVNLGCYLRKHPTFEFCQFFS